MVKHIPFLALITNTVVKLKNEQGYCTTLAIEGIDVQIKDEAFIDQSLKIWQQALSRLDVGFSIWLHRLRRREKLPGLMAPHLSAGKFFSHQYYRQLWSQDNQRLEIFLSLVYTNPQKSVLQRFTHREQIDAELASIAFLQTKAQKLVEDLAFFGCRILSAGGDSQPPHELLCFWNFLCNHQWKDPTRSSQTDWDTALWNVKLMTKDNVVQKLIPQGKEPWYLSSVVIKELQTPLHPSLLDNLWHWKEDFIETQSFQFATIKPVIKNYAWKFTNLLVQSLFDSSGKTEYALVLLQRQRAQLEAKEMYQGYYHYSLCFFNNQSDYLEHGIRNPKKIFDQESIHMIYQSGIDENLWWSQFPGNFQYRKLPIEMDKAEYSTLTSLHCPSRGVLPNKDKLTIWFETPYDQFFIWQIDQAFSEKLFTATLIVAKLAQAVSWLQLVLEAHLSTSRSLLIFDWQQQLYTGCIAKQHCCQFFFSPQVRTGLNPFKLPKSEESYEFIGLLIELMMMGSFNQFSNEEKQMVRKAVERVYAYPAHARHLPLFIRELLLSVDQKSHLPFAEYLVNWQENGLYAWVFANDAEGVGNNFEIGLESDHRVTFIDFGGLQEDEHLSLVLGFYLTKCLELWTKNGVYDLVVNYHYRYMQYPQWFSMLKKSIFNIYNHKGYIFQLIPSTLSDEGDLSYWGVLDLSASTFYFSQPNHPIEFFQMRFKLTELEANLVKNLPSQGVYLKHNQLGTVLLIDGT